MLDGWSVSVFELREFVAYDVLILSKGASVTTHLIHVQDLCENPLTVCLRLLYPHNCLPFV